MYKRIVLFIVIPILLIANPIPLYVINEFQTESSIEQWFELHLTNPLLEGPLLNYEVNTLAGTAVIDTNIYLPQDGYAIIDSSVLSGPFSLPPDSGFIEILTYNWEPDSVGYPYSGFRTSPAPPPGASAARFYDAYYDIFNYWWVTTTDWYIDFTPTYNGPNDNYPGCDVSGYVYGNGSPIENAMVVTWTEDYQWGYPEHTTHTSADGFYAFDGLMPVSYWIKVSASGYYTDSNLVFYLSAAQPITNFNFNLAEIGVCENNSLRNPKLFTIYPNPFKEMVEIRFGSDYAKNVDLKIYDIDGRCIKQFDQFTAQPLNRVLWDCRDDSGRRVPPGVYFVHFSEIIEKMVLLR